ncbi:MULTISPECIES: T7SS effector LXG polymorphic toxin [unclassified Bacillus (in: firmicutes)]|uniref:T7SS effector LXG polymorphic toxin n=1 Tax=unclassified Bacillus (in: firmicutes) TaxID=185979 RepID=UPI000D02558F|nr:MULTISPECIES: T7SS effector LXG polymorphic toxin [unclassified Bacillus (in: firmicutes)]PRR90353.1 transposase [Bacillus sp. NMCN1]PRR98130.1 transposase [Bacillus sp. NMCN6]
MKTLDAFALINGIDQTLNTLKQQSQQISSIEKQIDQIISLDGALKGEAGQAIRSFYTECHIPFLQFFQVIIEEYSATLKNTKQALHALESNQHGFISQSFIEHDLDQGLKKAERTISEIVTDVNHAIGRIGHIVHLPNIDESAFQQNYQKAWLETSRTVGLLHAFDREQTIALHETKSSLQTMKQYINTLSTMFTGPKIDITTYQKGAIFKDGKEEKVSSTISGLNDKIDNPKDNPMMLMLKKLREKKQAHVETVVHEKPSSKINQTTVTLNGKVYDINEYKKINFKNAKTVEIMRDGMLYRLRISEKNKVTIESVKPMSDVKTGDHPQNILNTAVEFTGINDAIRAITGRDPVTGDKVDDMDRLVSGVYMVLGANIVKVGKYVFKIIKGEKVAKRVEKSAKGARNGAKDFEKSLVKLPPAERVAAVKIKVKEVAKSNGLIKDSKLSKINSRDVYKDPKTGDLYSVDTQHGRFEKTNNKGKHQGEVDFDFKQTKPADASGGHNLKIK